MYNERFEFKHTYRDEFGENKEIVYSFEGDKTVTEVLEHVMRFMKAVSYVFDDINDRFGIVNDSKNDDHR